MNTTPNFANRRINSGANNMNAQEYPDDDKLDSPDKQNTQSEQNDRQPQYTGAYTMIPPIEARRSKLQRMAQKEEQDLQRWKEENRPGPIDLAPSQLGGRSSLEEARQKQFLQLRQSKLQKKLKQEDMERAKREAEEEQNQLKKAVQREKANKLEENTKQEELQRRYQYEQDHRARTEQFLQRVEKSNSAPTATSSSPSTSSWTRGREYRETQREEENMLLMQKKEEQRRQSELQEEKQKELEEESQRKIVMEHRRVNSAFLDKIGGRASSAWEAEPAPATPEDNNEQQALEPQVPDSSPGATLTPVLADGTEEDGNDPDWAVMKLINNFPFYERDFLEDIVDQCNGNYQQAYSLLQ
ncbi:hypothetical protein SKAU_G00251190 [Synaphobranchus kaupii]|uniref:Epithelial-stromal interaction protein 1 n=1 Tax=Synaphobranchus kaupii TaxID=118154 RepID=A0A9Q1F2U7_SYNKA|nr:hypothetical protein SKAU_G00251190 [Synaphobranchus kaupii]